MVVGRAAVTGLICLSISCRHLPDPDPERPLDPQAPLPGEPVPDGGSPDIGLDPPPGSATSWPFEYRAVAPSATVPTLLFSNFPEAVVKSVTADEGAAFFRASLEPRRRYRLVFDHFNRFDANGDDRPDTDLALFLVIQGTARNARSTVRIHKITIGTPPTEASQTPFVDFLNAPDSSVDTEFQAPGIFEQKLTDAWRAAGLVVGAIELEVLGDDPNYVLSLAASSRTQRERLDRTDLKYHGYAYRPGMKAADWRRQLMGISEAESSADVPLRITCDPAGASPKDNLIFHGVDRDTPLSLNHESEPDKARDGYPLQWGTHAHYLIGDASPKRWPDRGYVNLRDLVAIRPYRADRGLEPDYLRPIAARPRGIVPADPNERWLLFPMYERIDPTAIDPTGGADHGFRTEVDATGARIGNYANWSNFGVVVTQKVRIENDCHLPRRMHFHVVRPALVDVPRTPVTPCTDDDACRPANGGPGGACASVAGDRVCATKSGFWDRPMPCNVNTSTGLAIQVDDERWQDVRLGNCRRAHYDHSPATLYPVEQRAGFFAVKTVDVPARGRANFEYRVFMTPPSTQNVVHVASLDPLTRLEVPPGSLDYAHSPLARRRRWKDWEAPDDRGKDFRHAIDAIGAPGARLQDGDTVVLRPPGAGETLIATYRFHDEGRTRFFEKELASDGTAATVPKTLDPVRFVTDGLGTIELKVRPCPAGTTWSDEDRACVRAPPPFVGTTCPRAGAGVDWNALDGELATYEQPAKLSFARKLLPWAGGVCGPITTIELPVSCTAAFRRYRIWKMGGAVTFNRVLNFGSDYTWNPTYLVEGWWDREYQSLLAPQPITLLGSASKDPVAICDRVRSDRDHGPVAPENLVRMIRAYPEHRRSTPRADLPAGLDTCYDLLKIAPAGPLTPGCSNTTAAGAMYVVVESLELP